MKKQSNRLYEAVVIFVRNKRFPGNPHSEEHQNENERANTKDLFSWENYIKAGL
jgi:hypothetical protein